MDPLPHEPKTLGEFVARIGQEMIDLLPQQRRAMTPKETAMLEKWFGPEGRYPAVHLPTGELRGI